MIVFKNKGEIDLDAITTFGVNVKEVNNPIGFFGTGLKYAIAVILRHRCTIHITSGDNTYEFTTKSKTVRGKEFDFVYMNDQQLGFTTDLGKTWHLWMAYRELYCNAMDEGGDVMKTRMRIVLPEKKFTKVYVEGSEFTYCHDTKHRYILDKSHLLESGAHADVYKGRVNALFYRGIRVHDLMMSEAMYSYDVTRPVDLTEDRTLKWRHQAIYAITQLVLHSTNKDYLEKVLSAPAGTFEHDLDFTSVSVDPSRAFLEVAGKLREQTSDVGLNPTALLLHRENVTKSMLSEDSVVLNSIQQQQFNKAKDFVQEVLGCDMSRYPIIILEDLGPGHLGRADVGKIFLAVEVFEQGTKRVAAALYEEFIHLDTGCKDETLQQKWIYLQKILTLGEQLQGEPL